MFDLGIRCLNKNLNDSTYLYINYYKKVKNFF